MSETPKGIVAVFVGPDGHLPTEQSVSEIPDAELLSRAVNAARKRSARKGEKHPRWVAVMDAFQLGSGYAGELCRRFDLSPDEEVSR